MRRIELRELFGDNGRFVKKLSFLLKTINQRLYESVLKERVQVENSGQDMDKFQ